MNEQHGGEGGLVQRSASSRGSLPVRRSSGSETAPPWESSDSPGIMSRSPSTRPGWPALLDQSIAESEVDTLEVSRDLQPPATSHITARRRSSVFQNFLPSAVPEGDAADMHRTSGSSPRSTIRQSDSGARMSDRGDGSSATRASDPAWALAAAAPAADADEGDYVVLPVARGVTRRHSLRRRGSFATPEPAAALIDAFASALPHGVGSGTTSVSLSRRGSTLSPHAPGEDPLSPTAALEFAPDNWDSYATIKETVIAHLQQTQAPEPVLVRHPSRRSSVVYTGTEPLFSQFAAPELSAGQLAALAALRPSNARRSSVAHAQLDEDDEFLDPAAALLFAGHSVDEDRPRPSAASNALPLASRRSDAIPAFPRSRRSSVSRPSGALAQVRRSSVVAVPPENVRFSNAQAAARRSSSGMDEYLLPTRSRRQSVSQDAPPTIAPVTIVKPATPVAPAIADVPLASPEAATANAVAVPDASLPEPAPDEQIKVLLPYTESVELCRMLLLHNGVTHTLETGGDHVDVAVDPDLDARVRAQFELGSETTLLVAPQNDAADASQRPVKCSLGDRPWVSSLGQQVMRFVQPAASLRSRVSAQGAILTTSFSPPPAKTRKRAPANDFLEDRTAAPLPSAQVLSTPTSKYLPEYLLHQGN